MTRHQIAWGLTILSYGVILYVLFVLDVDVAHYTLNRIPEFVEVVT